MTKSIAVMGKAGVGKTLVSAHLAMAFGYYGEKTLLVGCDIKRDTTHAVTSGRGVSLIEALEMVGFDYDRLDLSDVIIPVNEYVDVMELGPSQLLVGHYGAVLEEAFHVFERFSIQSAYTRIVFDVNDERFDAAYAPLYRHANAAVGVTDESPESLFVLNRLLRAVLIGGYEYSLPMRIVGAINNRSIDSRVFEEFSQRTRCFPLATLPESSELQRLRFQQRTLFGLSERTPAQGRAMDDLLKVAEMLRGEPFNLLSISPLEDEEVWNLVPRYNLPI